MTSKEKKRGARFHCVAFVEDNATMHSVQHFENNVS